MWACRNSGRRSAGRSTSPSERSSPYSCSAGTFPRAAEHRGASHDVQEPTIPPTANDGHDPGSRAFLAAEGFGGFFTVEQLYAEACEGIPNEPGVYAVVRESLAPPEFLTRSVAAVWRGQDPTEPVEALHERWVPGAQVLYFGRAPGPGVRSRLKQRVKRYLRFGHGRVVGHWSGRFVWQLRDHTGLRVAWKTTDLRDAGETEARLQARFREHYGAMPFANLPQESEE